MAKTKAPKMELLERLKAAVVENPVICRDKELTELVIDAITELSAKQQVIDDYARAPSLLDRIVGPPEADVGDLRARLGSIARTWNVSPEVMVRSLIRAATAFALDNHVCRHCGCTADDAYIDPETYQPCSWADGDLCSACAATFYPNANGVGADQRGFE